MFRWIRNLQPEPRERSRWHARGGEFLTMAIMAASGLPPSTGDPELDAILMEDYARSMHDML